jgi:Xaa-Pro aminopeptidase
MTHHPDERKYRHELTYAFMDEHGLDGIVMFGADRSDRYDAGQWFARDRRYQHLVVPRDGEPVMLSFAPQVLAQHMLSIERGLETWIEDFRVGRVTDGIPDLIREKKLDRARIGVIGIGYGSAFYPGGWVSKLTWDAITEQLPDTTFVDITADFGLVMARRSEHDLQNIAKAAAAGDAAIEAMMRIAEPGVSETALYAAGINEMLTGGMRVTWMLLQTGLDNYAWGEPTWLMRPEDPRCLAGNDQVWAEIFPNYAEMNTHVNMTFTIGEVPEVTRRCAEAAQESYRVGVNALRPGRTLADVAELMEEPLAEINAWHITPHIASLNPLLAGGDSGASISDHLPGFAERFGTMVKPERMGMNFEIQEGMTFSLQPDARIGRHGACVGGVVAVTADGVREFNTVSTQMRSAG